MTYKCGTYGDAGHNKRTCPTQAGSPRTYRPCYLCGETTHTPRTCEWAATARATNGVARDEDLVILCTRSQVHRSGKHLVHMMTEGEGHIEVRTYVRDHLDPRILMAADDEVGAPVFSTLTEMVEWWQTQAEVDGRGDQWHRPAQIPLEYAKKTWPHLIFADPQVYPRSFDV